MFPTQTKSSGPDRLPDRRHHPDPAAITLAKPDSSIIATLALVIAERHEAWEQGVLEGFADGWEQRGAYEAERVAA